MNDDIRTYIDDQIRNHVHDGNFSTRINTFDLFGEVPTALNLNSATIATTGNTDIYCIAPINGVLDVAYFSALDALASSDTNYIIWTITNLGQAGSGSTAMLLASTVNQTRATGGSAIAANTKRTFTLSSTPNDTQVVEGDRLRIRAAVTGTLANTVTHPVYLLLFK